MGMAPLDRWSGTLRSMTSASRRTKLVLAQEAWSLMFDFLMETAPQRSRSLASRNLTPNDSRALMHLDPDVGQPLRSLAQAWECDPSNATWIVDRLERSGLAERRVLEGDRRVKLVALTPLGVQIRQTLLDEFRRPPAALQRLDRDELDQLERLLRKLRPSSD